MKNVMHGLAALLLAIGTMGFAGQAAAAEGDLIINEYNAVGPEKTLEEGYDPAFGPVAGNGGEWIELVVTRDLASIVGWTIYWENDDPDTGHLTFVDNAVWRNLKAGTIITIREGDTNDTSYNAVCTGGDWTIRVNANDTTYITQAGAAHSFKTDNDGWQAMIEDAGGNTVQGLVGENGATDSAISWAGSGLGSTEVGKLEADPSAAAADDTTDPNYQDGNCSSFGAPNCWDDGAEQQDFDGLRGCTP